MAPTQLKPNKSPAGAAGKALLSPKRARSRSAQSDDDILETLEARNASSVTSEPEKTSFMGRSGLRVLGIIILVVILLVLKSGEDSYHAVMSSTQTTDTDPYTTLGISKTATRPEVRAAYRKLSLEWHPDRREGGCADDCKLRFKRISESYKLLMNSASRKLYDETQKVTGGSTRAFYNQLAPSEYMVSEPVWKNIITPSLEGRQLWTSRDVSGVWVFLVADPKSEWTEHLIPLWSDLASKYYGRISFARVDETNEEVAKLLPVKLAITPAIMILRPNDVPVVYDKMLHFQPRHLIQWLNDNIPDCFRPWKGSAKELRTLLQEKQVSPDGRLPVVVYSAKEMAGLYKALGLRTISTIDWIRVEDSQLFRNAFEDVLPRRAGWDASKKFLIAPAGVAGAAEGRNKLKVLPVSSNAWHLDKVNLHQRGDLEDDDESNFMHEQLLEDIESIVRGNEVPLFDDNFPWICPPASPDERVLCSIRVDPVSTLTADEMAERQMTTNDVQIPANDIDDAGVEVEEYEDTESFGQAKISTKRTQLCRINTSGIRGYASALARGAGRELDRVRLGKALILDTAGAAYKWTDEMNWTNLPAACQTATGRTLKRLPLSWLWSRESTDCAPRWRLGYRTTLRYWCSLHWMATSLIFGVPILVLGLWPRGSKPATTDPHDKKE